MRVERAEAELDLVVGRVATGLQSEPLNRRAGRDVDGRIKREAPDPCAAQLDRAAFGVELDIGTRRRSAEPAFEVESSARAGPESSRLSLAMSTLKSASAP